MRHVGSLERMALCQVSRAVACLPYLEINKFQVTLTRIQAWLVSRFVCLVSGQRSSLSESYGISRCPALRALTIFLQFAP